MPSNDGKPATFLVQSVFAVGGQGVLMGIVQSGEILSGMTTMIQNKRRTVTKVEGKQGKNISKPVVGVTLSESTIEDLQSIGNGELLFNPPKN